MHLLLITLIQTVNATKINVSNQDTNEKIVEFNTKCITENTVLLKEGTFGVSAAAATPESNAALIKSNSDRLAVIMEKANKNKMKINAVMSEAERNRAAIESNTDAIYERRARVQTNTAKIASNQIAIAEFVGEFDL
jgi:hypothetical protein